MKRNIRREIVHSMDSIRFSPEQKDSMVRNLMTAQTASSRPLSTRRLVLLAAAAVLLIAMLTGAAAFTRWSATAQHRYNPSENIKEQAQQSGLSVLLETENPNEDLSATDNGVTITAVQTIADNYGAEVTFRIDGFELPEDKLPQIWPQVAIDRDPHFGGLQTGSFFDGTTVNDQGEWVYVSTGEPVKLEQDGEYQSVILDFVAEDGSLEYTHYIRFEETDGRYFGKEITFTFDSIDIQSDEKAGMSIPLVEGTWELKWILTGADTCITVTPNTRIGDSDVILLDARIGQKTVRARYQVDAYWEGWDELVTLPQAVCGVRMKDGSEHICGAGTAGFEDPQNGIYFTEFDIHDAILDLSQVESLMFHKGFEADENGELTVQTFYYIPIA